MEKQVFAWQELKRLLPNLSENSRTKNVIERLFAGEKVNLNEYPSAPKKNQYSKRSPSSFRLLTKKLLTHHKGVIVEGDTVYILELQRKINWTDVV